MKERDFMEEKSTLPKVWVIDRNVKFYISLEMNQTYRNMDIEYYSNGQALLHKTIANQVGCFLINLYNMDGLSHYCQLLEHRINQPAIFLLEDDNIPLAVQLVRQGAYDVLVKPIPIKYLSEVVQQAIHYSEQCHEASQYCEPSTLLSISEPIVFNKNETDKNKKYHANQMDIVNKTLRILCDNILKKQSREHITEYV